MNLNIQDLYNRSIEALINAMKQYVNFIGINSSIRSLDIQFHYLESISQNNIITKYELLDKQSKRQNLLIEKETVKQDIISQSYKSIILALALVDTSVAERDKFGLEMSSTLLQSILKFIQENKHNISIPIDALIPQMMSTSANLVKSGLNSNQNLTISLNQLMTL